jgi:hypothetical protein
VTVPVTTCSPGQTSPSYPSSTPDIETIEEFFVRCPTTEEISQINADLTITFEYDPTVGTLACHSPNLTALQKRAYQTIFVMSLLNFSRPLPWTDKQLYDWFVGAIDGIRFVEGGYSHCCEPENVIVIALESDSDILQTDRWVSDVPDLGLMHTTLLYAHEARHNEGFHHTCTTRNGDDNTLDEMGAWAIHHYLALWIAQYGDQNFLHADGDDPEYYRQIALEDAETIRLIRFCKEVYTKPAPTLVK